METRKNPEDQYVLSWSDLKIVLKRSKKTILYGALGFAFLASVFTLSRDTTYIAQGTFREKNKQANSNEKTLSALLMSGGATAAESMAITTIKSRRVLEQVANELNLQGTVQRKDERNFLVQKATHYLNNIWNNLVVESAYLTKKYKPVVEDPPKDLTVSAINYQGEIASTFELRFVDSNHFTVHDSNDAFMVRSQLGHPIHVGDTTFTIKKNIPGQLPVDTYILAIHPLHRIADNQLANLVVEADKLDKTLLKINYYDIDRHQSSKFLNTVMNTYRHFLVDEHVRVTEDQVAYLKKRQADMDKQLVQLMEDHAINIASNDASIEFLVKTQQNYKTKLLNIDLETKHLEKAQKEGITFFERHSADGESPVVQGLLGEIRKYRQQADTLELALRDAHIQSPDYLHNMFNEYVDELQTVHAVNKETRKLLADLENGHELAPADTLLVNPKYLVKPWLDRLSDAKEANELASFKEKTEKEEALNDCQAQFTAYLANLLHLFDVQQKTIQDRLTHQQNPRLEFQGIDLETANGLYVMYSKELHSLEADLAQKEFIIQQLSQPEFEISSINSIMDDAISREIINKTSLLMLTLKDEPNRTTRELDRLRRDIDIQKGFLIVHLKQMCDVLRLREQLLEDKIHSLQSVTLELVRQKISIQEKHLADYINSRLNNLKHEKQVITQHQYELQKELDELPEKWAFQKLVDHHMLSNQNIVHQIASMIESKTIAENLEVSQSAPFDEAVVPVLPRNPRLLLFAAIGGLGGAFLTFSFCLLRSASHGVEATQQNLRAIQQNVAGCLSHASSLSNLEDLSLKDIETLRKLLLHLTGSPPTEKGQVALIESCGPHFTEAFAGLLAKQGHKVLLLPLSFEISASETKQPGLLDVLEGRVNTPHIIKGLYFDEILSGGHSRLGLELLKSSKFKTLLNELSSQYDWVIGYTRADPLSVEAEGLLSLFPALGVFVSGENLDELAPYFQASHKGKAVGFVF